MPRKRKRGRPEGSAHYALADDELLGAAALHLSMGRCSDLTGAVKFILGERATPTIMRRLHRRWSAHQARYEKAAAQTMRGMRADIDYQALKENQPRLARRVRAFANSAKGKVMLAEHGVEPSMPLQLGLYTVIELIEASDPKGAAQADRFFARAVNDWTASGFEPDVAFLNRFAERVRLLAAEIEARAPSGLDPDRPFEEGSEPGLGGPR